MSQYTENVARFGPEKALVGILTAPTSRRADRPTIVIVSTGIVHRVGLHREYVCFARTLAKAGFAVLRFDLAGLGDSPVRDPAPDPVDAANADLRDALDWLATQGLHNIILMGSCSGGDRSVAYAAMDQRVRGLILFDPLIPPTRRFLRYRLAKIVRENPLPTLAGRLRRAKRLFVIPTKNERDAGPAAWLKIGQIRGFLENAYARANANGAKILAIFTSSMEHRYNYPEQMLEAFPRIDFGGRLSLHYLEGVEHLLVLERERSLYLTIVTEWLQCLTAGGTDQCLVRSNTPATAQLRETTPQISA